MYYVYMLHGVLYTGLHTENEARGANWEFPKCRGGVYTMN